MIEKTPRVLVILSSPWISSPTDTIITEQTSLATTDVGAEQINNINTGLQDFSSDNSSGSVATNPVKCE